MLPQILDRGTIDVVLNGFEWSAEREQLWSSTIPYYIYKLQLMARKDDDSIRSWDDLVAKPGQPRKSVGVLQGSAAERYVEERFGDAVVLKKYPEVTSVMGLVEQGQLDATVQDVPIAIHYGPDFPGLHSVGEPLAPGYYVAYVRKGDERAPRSSSTRRSKPRSTTARSSGSTKNTASGTTTKPASPKSPRTGRPPPPPRTPAGPTCPLHRHAAQGRVDDHPALVPLDAAGHPARADGRGRPAVRSLVDSPAVRGLRRVPPRHAALAPTVRHLLRAAASHGREPARVLGRRARTGNQLLGLRGGELPRRPAWPSRADRWKPPSRSA